MKTRALFESLGFQKDWEAITDQRPAYYYDFGNLRLTAAEVMSPHFGPCFHFGGVCQGARSISMVDFEMPLEVESLEQGVAWIAYGIGEEFLPRRPTPWLTDGWTWQDRLPWVRRMEEYKARPMCSVEKDWFKLAAKKLRPLADSASESDLVWLSFNGETLRIAGCGATVILPAIGTAWDARYAIKATQLDHLPKRLANPVVIGVWEGRLTIGRQVWNLVESEILLDRSSSIHPTKRSPPTSPSENPRSSSKPAGSPRIIREWEEDLLDAALKGHEDYKKERRKD